MNHKDWKLDKKDWWFYAFWPVYLVWGIMSVALDYYASAVAVMIVMTANGIFYFWLAQKWRNETELNDAQLDKILETTTKCLHDLTQQQDAESWTIIKMPPSSMN